MVRIRPAGGGDGEALWRLLAYAASVPPDEDVRQVPYVTRFAAGWGDRPADVGVVAEHGDDVVGAAWARLLLGDERDTPAFVAPDVAELCIAVEPAWRGAGLGTRLLTALLDRARAEGRLAGISLTVRTGNPARRLYERAGFTDLDLIPNRVGGSSHRMVARFRSEAPTPPHRDQNPE